MEFDKEKIKIAVKEFNQWQGDAAIMCDEEDGAVWTDVFASENDWNEYHASTIQLVTRKSGIQARNAKTSVKKITEALETGEYKKEF